MKVMKATDAALDAIRKMETVSRVQSRHLNRKQSSFCMEEVNTNYSGPFAVSWYSENSVMISCKRPDYGSANGYCGSICAPDMMIVKHVQGAVVNYVPNSGNDLLVLIASWSSGSTVNTSFRFVPDPWTTCSDADRMIAADAANPVTQEFPLRDPRVSVYPVARIISGNKIIQLQNGHIVDYNRWWRA